MPFDDNEASYIVLINDECQYSLWPESNEIPSGWTQSFGPALREACLSFVDGNWKDMRPRSLQELT